MQPKMKVTSKTSTLKPAYTKELRLADIRVDGNTQTRGLCQQTILEYGEHLDELPPVDVFLEDSGRTEQWLANGFHRLETHKRAGRETIIANVYLGNVHDARRFAAGANATHGLKRSNDAKHAAVLMLLHDEKWQNRSAAWIANTAKVSAPLVAAARAALGLASTVRETSDGRTIDTADIGKRTPAEPADAEPTPAPESPKEPAEPNVEASDETPGAPVVVTPPDDTWRAETKRKLAAGEGVVVDGKVEPPAEPTATLPSVAPDETEPHEPSVEAAALLSVLDARMLAIESRQPPPAQTPESEPSTWDLQKEWDGLRVHSRVGDLAEALSSWVDDLPKFLNDGEATRLLSELEDLRLAIVSIRPVLKKIVAMTDVERFEAALGPARPSNDSPANGAPTNGTSKPATAPVLP